MTARRPAQPSSEAKARVRPGRSEIPGARGSGAASPPIRPLARATGAAEPPIRRRNAIQRLLTATPVVTQEELRQRLAQEGFVATQTTLSRDLARLGARRFSRPGGGTGYTLDGLTARAESAHEWRELIVKVSRNDSLVVLLTRPGAASAIARALDEQRPAEVLATLAGDDTIFIAPALGVSTRRLLQAVNQLFGRE